MRVVRGVVRTAGFGAQDGGARDLREGGGLDLGGDVGAQRLALRLGGGAGGRVAGGAGDRAAAQPGGTDGGDGDRRGTELDEHGLRALLGRRVPPR